MSAIKEPYEKYLMVGATIYSMCLETFKTINTDQISSEMREKMVLETITMIAKKIAECEMVGLN